MYPAEPRHNPYVGPRAITEGEPLFGRSREVRQLFQMFAARRIALLHSPSGAGKTSLIQAGLIPQLKADGFRVLPVARVNKEPPGAVPGDKSFNRYIYSLLLSLEERPAGQFDEALATVSLADYLAPHYGSEDDPELIVLILDQFEELLTADPSDVEQKAAFFAQVGQALRNPHLWALFVIREDYLGALEPYTRAIPTRLANTFRLDLLETEAASEAIRRPAEAQGVQFAPQAVEALVDDLRLIQVQQPDGSFHEQLGPYVEPVQLQVVCRRLWQRLAPEKVEITEADLETSGDVDDSLASYYAERLAAIAMNEEIAESERAVRQWVEKKLITRDGIRHPVLKDQEVTEGLDNRAIDMLRDAHLVRAEQRGGMTWFELAHDRLVGPIRQDNAHWFENNLSLLQRQAERWKEEDYEKRDFLLLHGESLAEAEAWAASHPDALSKADRDLLEASRKEREREEEEQRQQLALAEEQRRRADEQRQRAEEAETAAFRHRRLTRVAVALLAVATVAAILAGVFSIRASRNADLAEASKEEALAAKATAEHNANVAAAREAEADQARTAAVAAQGEALAAVAARKEADSQRLAARAEQYLAGGNVTAALLVGHIAVAITTTADAETALVNALRAGGDELRTDDLTSLLDLACRRAGRNLTVDEWQETLPAEPYPLTCSRYAHISYPQQALLACTGAAAVEEARNRFAMADKPLVDGRQVDFETWALPLLLQEAVALQGKSNESRVRACLDTAVATGFRFDDQAFLQLKSELAALPQDFGSTQSTQETLEKLEGLVEPLAKQPAEGGWPAIVSAAFDESLADIYLKLCVNMESPDEANRACAARNEILQRSSALAHFVAMTRTEATADDGTTGLHQAYSFQGNIGVVTIALCVREDALMPGVTLRDESGSEIISQIPNAAAPASAAGQCSAILGQTPITESNLLTTLPAGGNYTIELASEDEEPLAALALVRAEATQIVLGNSVDAPATARLWQFEGQRNDVVIAAMETLESGDTYLKLLDSSGRLVQDNDDYGGVLNSRIQVALPADGTYYLDAGWYGGAQGVSPYRLTLTRVDSISIGDRREGTADQTEWVFAGSAGQFVTVAVEPRDGQDTPLLSVLDQAGNVIGSTETGAGNQTTREIVRLPADGLYYVNVDWPGEPGDYELSLSSGELQELAFGETVGRAEQHWWAFESPAGAAVRISMDARDSQGLPVLRLSDPSGNPLAADESAADSAAFICDTWHPGAGRFVLEAAWAANPGDYTLRLEPGEAQMLESGRLTLDAPAEQCLYQFAGRGGQFVAVTMEALEAGGDPTLTLLDDQGTAILSNDDTFGLNSRLAMLLPADGRYFVKAGWFGNTAPGNYTLHFVQGEPETLAIGDTLTALSPEQSAWQFEGDAGDLLTIAMDAADPEGNPLLGLYDETGQAIAQADGGGTGLNARLVAKLPADGVYFIDAGWQGESTTYSLSISQQLQAGELSLPTDSMEAGPEQWAWQFQGDFGDAVTVRMEALEEGGAPLLRLYDPTDTYVDLPVDQNEGVAELRYTLTQPGLYLIEAGWAANPGRYRLTIDVSQPALDMVYVANALRGNLLQLLQDGLISDALTLLTQIELIEASGQTAVLQASDYNQVCWHGSLLGYAPHVLFACEEAVARAPDDVGIIDSRGIARAIAGDLAGAIADFRAFIAGGYVGNETFRAEREQWIAEFEAGRNPFEDATLREYIRLNE